MTSIASNDEIYSVNIDGCLFTVHNKVVAR